MAIAHFVTRRNPVFSLSKSWKTPSLSSKLKTSPKLILPNEQTATGAAVYLNCGNLLLLPSRGPASRTTSTPAGCDRPVGVE